MNERILQSPAKALFIIFGILVLALSTFSFVPETKQGVVVRFGEPVGLFNPYVRGESFGNSGAGLYVRIPFLEQVEWINKRTLSLEMTEQEVLSTDQRLLRVDAYARYRIVDPLRMYRAARSEQRLKDALQPLLTSAVRNELSKETFASLLTPERGQVMLNIRNGMNKLVSQYGVEIEDVQIIRAEWPKGTPLESAFNRMKTARRLEAETIREDGWRRAQIIRAEADQAVAKTFADSFGKDPKFYDFYRAMESYKHTFGTDGTKPTGSTSIVLSPNNDYLRQFRGN